MADELPGEHEAKPETIAECDGCKELRPKVASVMEQLAGLTTAPPVEVPEEITPDTKPHSVPWTHRGLGGDHV